MDNRHDPLQHPTSKIMYDPTTEKAWYLFSGTPCPEMKYCPFCGVKLKKEPNHGH